MVLVTRQAVTADGPRLWALNNLPNVGETADATVPLALPVPDAAPAEFPDLADVVTTCIGAGGDFAVVELDRHLVGMGGIKPSGDGHAEVLRVRTHPATRRRGVGRAVMTALERSASALGVQELHLDTADNQPDAMRFYRALGYTEVTRKTQPDWTWTLVFYAKRLAAGPAGDAGHPFLVSRVR